MSERVSTLDPELGARLCSSCGGRILWSITESGKRMPVDLAPHPDGNIEIKVGHHEGKRVWRSRSIEIGERVDVRRKSHFATCPNAAQHRSKKP